MWQEGSFVIDDIRFIYSAKVFELGSEFGIHNGRISKLAIWKVNPNGATPYDNLIINYDRGWDLKPRPCDILHNQALEYVLDLYPVT